MKKILLSSLLISSISYISADTINFQVENIQIETNRNLNKLTNEEKIFPLEITGYDTKRYYQIKSKSDMKKALQDAFTKPFNQVILNCIYQRHCEMEKDLEFAVSYIKDSNTTLQNKIKIIKQDGIVEGTVEELLSNPTTYMLDISEEDKQLINKNKEILSEIQLKKREWIKMENNIDLKPLTNMFIKKYNLFHEREFEKVVSYENKPRFLSSLVGSEYCETDLFEDRIIMNLKCDIPIYDYNNGKDNLNALFVNTSYVGIMESKKVVGDKILYKLKDQSDIRKYYYSIDEKFSQLNKFYYGMFLDSEFSRKQLSNNPFILNEDKNKEFKEKIENEFKEFLLNNKTENLNILEEKLKENRLRK